MNNLDVQLKKMDAKQNEILHLLQSLSNGEVAKQNKVYCLTDLAEMLQVSRRTLFKWKSEGKLIFSQIGKKLYITDEELKIFLTNNKVGGTIYGERQNTINY